MLDIINFLTYNSFGISSAITKINLFPEFILFIMSLFMLFIKNRNSIIISAIVIFLATLLYQLYGHKDALTIISFDPISWITMLNEPLLIKIIVAKISLIIILQYNKKYKIKPELIFLMMMSLIGSCLLISFDNLMYIFVSLEMQSLSAYIMVALDKSNNKSSEASLKYFIVGSLASCIMLYGISLLYYYCETLSLLDIINLVNNNQGSIFITVATYLFITGLLFKIGIAPYHNWMADVYEAAHPIVTSFIATIPKITVLYLLNKLTILGMHSKIIAYILIFVGLLSMIMGAFSALKQSDIRRMLAYGTTSQMGYIILCIAMGIMYNKNSYTSVIYITMYSLCIIGFFSCIIQFKNYAISGLQSLRHTNPVIAILITLITICISGLPPFPIFITKIMLMKDIIEYSDPHNIFMGTIIVSIIMIFSIISMLYYLNIIKNIYFNCSDKEVFIIESNRISSTILFFMIIINFIYTIPLLLYFQHSIS